jgi:ribosomal protein L24E
MLESKSSENEIETDNWGEEMKPGRTIYMTMVVRHKGAVSDNCCPKCRATNIQKIGKSKKIKW